MPLIRDTNYGEIPFKIKPVWLILVVVVFGTGFYLNYAQEKTNERSYYKHKKITTGIVTDFSLGHYDYYYWVDGRKYYDHINASRFSVSLINRKFPVAYDSLYPSYNEILVTKYLYKELNLPIPDSIDFDKLYK